MRLSLRLILSLIGGVTAVALVFAVVQAGTEMQAEKVEVQRQALVLARSEEHTSELQLLRHLVCRLLLEKKKPRARYDQYHREHVQRQAIQHAHVAELTVRERERRAVMYQQQLDGASAP